jgi:hypothetical protein
MIGQRITLTVALLFATACTISGGASTPDVAREVDELSKLLRDRQIARVEILHMSDAILTLIDVTPEVLRQRCRYKVVITEPWESPDLEHLLTALSKVKASRPDKPGDLRWAILFFDVRGKERCAIFWDRFGTHGVFQHVPLSLDGRLLIWARQITKNAFFPSAPARK